MSFANNITGQEPCEELINALGRLYDEGTYSDMSIISGGSTYRIHKAIVCPRSAFFARAFDSTSKFKEANTGVMELPEDNPQAVQLMIHYFYHLDYPHVSFYDELLHETASNSSERKEETSCISPRSSGSPAIRENVPEPLLSYEPQEAYLEAQEMESEESFPVFASKKKKKKQKKPNLTVAEPQASEVVPEPNLILHAEVYALAEKFGVEGLKSLALQKFNADATKHWDTEDFLQAAKVVYTSTVPEDRAMRDAVVKTFHEHKTLLRTQLARNYIRDIPGLAYDVLLRAWNGSTWY